MAAGSALVAVALGWAGTTWVLSNGPVSSLGGPLVAPTIPPTTIPDAPAPPGSITPLLPRPVPRPLPTGRSSDEWPNCS